MAIDRAIDLKIALSEASEQEMAFESARLTFRPQLFFSTTAPNLNRSIEARPLPDGSDAFVNRSTMYNGIGLDLTYQIEKTGGILSLTSNLERLDIFATDQFDRKKTYFINPFSIDYTQPLFQFNELKWQKERLGLLYAEFKERYARTREDIILEAIVLFRACYMAQQQSLLAERKLMETDTLKGIKDRLFEIGSTTLTEILRLELDQRNHLRDKLIADLQWTKTQRALLDYVGQDRVHKLILTSPEAFDDLTIPIDDVVQLAVKNRFVTSAQESRMAEHRADLDRASKDKDIEFNLRASLGLNRSSEQFRTLLNPLLDREIFSATIRMPITGWRRYDLREKMAQARIEQEQYRQEKEQLELSRLAIELVTEFELLKQNLDIQESALESAEEILEIVRRQFLSGTASHTDISVSGSEREQATINYYNALLDILERYYQIRRLCMYDFVQDVDLSGN